MKTVILAGGFGTRIGEVNGRPKPLITIGDMPVIWHIMKIYSVYGINEFVVCCGYKADMIKEYFSNHFLPSSDIKVYVKNNDMEVYCNFSEPWKISLIDTGLHTMTGGRIKRIKNHIKNDTFCLCYGDDLKNVNIQNLINFHHTKKTLATMTVCLQPNQFGIVDIENDKVTSIKEKLRSDSVWINGGYFVLEPEIFDYIKDDSTVWEHEPLEKLAKKGQLSAFKYTDYYQPLDTIKDKNQLEELWNANKAYWKIW